MLLGGFIVVSITKLQQLNYWRNQYKKLNQELHLQFKIHNNQKVELHETKIRLEESQLAFNEKQRLLLDSEQRLIIQFENLANRIFEKTKHQVNEQNKQCLNSFLLPLNEQLNSFRCQIQESYGREARERHALTYEIRSLQQLNAQMAKEAINLTKALKGDNKIQGNWGEVILNKILEASGLREGHEYQTQVNIKIDNNSRIQPDVIVRLPQDKDIIIDAKISLVAYERYFNSENKEQKKLALNEHIASLRGHIKALSKKDYHQFLGSRSLDYVLMFIPIEPAFLVAIDQQPELINEALQSNIMLVSPNTLLMALRTINNLWRYQYQNNNTQQIAEQASKLYDKLRLFIDDMESVGQSINKAQITYEQAMNKLAQGRGNLIRQAENFHSLGVKIKKPISSIWVEKSNVKYGVKNNPDLFNSE
ncbi:DNA recombination protein RmuC [Candidatus Fukatsuia anoeciicola]|uniref:DNA recombination protein RmuC n=1 Tax=Candidatus Fukatsuia anoeciicola TaxID=2994492 RepID=UPI00346480A7